MTLSKTQELRLKTLLAVPWRPRVERTEDGFVASIPELPEFVAAADREDEIEGVFWDALRAVLMDYVARDETPPLPEGAADRLSKPPVRRPPVLLFTPAGGSKVDEASQETAGDFFEGEALASR